jgi:thioredoxin 1
MIVQLESSNFDATVLTDGIAVIDSWAPWCAACKDFDQVFAAAAERHRQHVFASLNTHEQDELAKRLRITHIPTIILFRDGLLLLRQPGHLTASEIDEMIQKAESLDMQQVRTDMEQREQSRSA